MRRVDREVKDKDTVIEIIKKCDVCRIAFSNNNTAYIVPMNYGYEYIGGQLTLYFHSAKEGKKIDMMWENPVVCFEMDCAHRLVQGVQACDYTMEYESVIGSGTVSVCNGKDEKINALNQIMKVYAGDGTFHFSDQALNRVTVFKLEVYEFTGKRSIKNTH